MLDFYEWLENYIDSPTTPYLKPVDGHASTLTYATNNTVSKNQLANNFRNVKKFLYKKHLKDGDIFSAMDLYRSYKHKHNQHSVDDASNVLEKKL